MTEAIEKLCALGGPSLSEKVVLPEATQLTVPAADLLNVKNGFLAFESALHVYACSARERYDDIIQRNSTFSPLIRYGISGTCFAEDIFGFQYFIDISGPVLMLDLESGVVDFVAEDLEGWAKYVLSDIELSTGWNFARQWQIKNGAIPPGMRLSPKIPFVLGGDYNIDNMFLADSFEICAFRYNLYKQIKNMSDGESVILELK